MKGLPNSISWQASGCCSCNSPHINSQKLIKTISPHKPQFAEIYVIVLERKYKTRPKLRKNDSQATCHTGKIVCNLAEQKLQNNQNTNNSQEYKKLSNNLTIRRKVTIYRCKK